MINPFQYGGVVGEDAFCNRKRELADVGRAIKNGERLFIYSERRMGKTSLIRLALAKLPKKQYSSAYVDLWPTDGEDSFARATAKAITKTMATTTEKMLQLAKRFFGGLRPSITIDSLGNPQITFGLIESAAVRPELEEVLTAPARIAAEQNLRLVIVFDEIQRILEYGTDFVERSLRSAIQNQQEVSYLFLGSRKHLIQRMFLDKSRPLYRAGGHYPLGPIDSDDWLPFIRERFNKSDKRISDGLVGSVCKLTAGHPFYTQHLCHAIWEQCETGKKVTEELIDSAMSVLLDRENYAYTAMWESLTLNQRRFLTGLSAEPENPKVFASRFVQSYKLGSASNVQRVAKALQEKDIVDRDNSSFVISDRFFRIWIRQMDLGLNR